MALKTNQQKWEDVIPECKKIWQWLRQQPEYARDYERFIRTTSYQRYCKQNSYSLQKKCPIAREKTIGSIVRTKKATKYLSWGSIKDELGLKKKWGFFPLTDPRFNIDGIPGFKKRKETLMERDGFFPAELVQVTAICGGSIEKGFVWLKNHNVIKNILTKQKPKLPKTLLFEINPYIAPNVLARELHDQVKSIQKFYKIKGQRIRYNGFHANYVAFVGYKLGWSQAKIRREVFGPDAASPSYNSRMEARRQTVKRIAKKLSSGRLVD